MDEMDAILNSMAASSGNISQKIEQDSRIHADNCNIDAGTESGVWNPNVQVALNAVTSSEKQKKPCNLMNVTPAMELCRQRFVQKLRSKIHASVAEMGLPKLPNSAYETWQFCSKLVVPDVR